MGLAKTWPVEDAWHAAVAVVAATYGLETQLLTQESRGRGARPPPAAWMAKKTAVWLAIALSGCRYVDAARALRLHKDTISSHCEDVRRAASDEGFEVQLDSLHALAIARLETVPAKRAAHDPQISLRSLLLSICERLTRIESRLDALADHPFATDENAGSSVRIAAPEKKVEAPNVVELVARRM